MLKSRGLVRSVLAKSIGQKFRLTVITKCTLLTLYVTITVTGIINNNDKEGSYVEY